MLLLASYFNREKAKDVLDNRCQTFSVSRFYSILISSREYNAQQQILTFQPVFVISTKETDNDRNIYLYDLYMPIISFTFQMHTAGAMSIFTSHKGLHVCVCVCECVCVCVCVFS